LDFFKIQDGDGGHLENRKIGNDIKDIADRSQFWHVDAYLPSPPCRPVKVRTSENRKWRTDAILKIEKPQPLLEYHTVTLRIWENARLGRKVNFAFGKIPSGGKNPRNCIYTVPAQGTAKHPAKSC